jgi:hypothetical protein
MAAFSPESNNTSNILVANRYRFSTRDTKKRTPDFESRFSRSAALVQDSLRFSSIHAVHPGMPPSRDCRGRATGPTLCAAAMRRSRRFCCFLGRFLPKLGGACCLGAAPFLRLAHTTLHRAFTDEERQSIEDPFHSCHSNGCLEPERLLG